MQLVGVVVRTFGEAYPELVKHQEKIHAVISEEEASFSRTLGKGIERFKKLAAAAQVRGTSVFACVPLFCEDVSCWFGCLLHRLYATLPSRVWLGFWWVDGVGW
jgi:hypothetical protein